MVKESTTKVYAKIYSNGIRTPAGIQREDFDPPLEMTLKQMQQFVGGLIQACRCTIPRRTLIVNEEGAYLPLGDNPIATNLAAPEMMLTGFLKGNALLVGGRW